MSKWLNKRQQAVSERLNKDARRTEADGDFQDLAMQTEATQRAVMKMLDRVPQFLHPNPNARVKAAVGTTVAKLRKTAAEKKYPHSSGELATVMEKASTDLPPDSAFGTALRTLTDSFRQIEESEHQMDAEVQQNFLSPLKDLQESELKEIARLKKKLEGRRLDFDYKQRKRESGKGTVTDDDLKVAKQKYEDSKATTENAMMNLLNNDLEQVGQLAAFVDAYVSKTRATLTALLEAQTNLGEILEEAQSRPKREARPVSTYQYEDDDDFADSGAAAADGDGPCALAAYDFEAENEGELSFKEGQTITLLNRLDENWLEGQVDDRVGIFPSNYVEIIRDV